MRWRLFPAADHLGPLARAAHLFCAVAGVTTTFFSLFVVVVEVVTSPLATPWGAALNATCVVLSAIHIVKEARSQLPLSTTQWLLFAAAVSLFSNELWTTIKDPTARWVFLAVLLSGSVMLLISRLVWCAGLPKSPAQDSRADL